MLAAVNRCGCVSPNSQTCGLSVPQSLYVYVPVDFFCCKEIQEIVCRAKQLIREKYKDIANEVANSIIPVHSAKTEDQIILIRAICKALETYQLPVYLVDQLTAKLKRLTTLLNC